MIQDQSPKIYYWSPKTPFINSFEEEFDSEAKIKIIKQYWWITIILSIIYLILVFYGVKFMKSRPPFNLRKSLAIWNTILAIFSFFGALHVLPEAIYARNQSLHYFFCVKESIVINRTLQFWVYLFSVSKVIEFGDTLFIILRKQKLSFLHYIHHAITLIFSFYTFGQNSSLMRMGVSMNYSVHTIMYSYYTLKALRFRLPRFISIIITILQISQMIVGFYGMFYCLRATLDSKMYCDATVINALFGLCVYLLFLILFCNFFIRTYLISGSSFEKNKIKKKF